MRPEPRGRERAVLCRSPLRISANQPDWAVVPFGTQEDTESAANREPETSVETVEKGATGLANVEPLRRTEIRRRRLEPWGGQSASSPMGRSGRVPDPQTKRKGSLWTARPGCDTSSVSRRVIPDLQLKQTTHKLYDDNGTEIALLREVELTLTMSVQEVTAAVVVCEEVDDIILGIDWLGRHHCRWSFAQKLVQIDGNVVRLISRLPRT